MLLASRAVLLEWIKDSRRTVAACYKETLNAAHQRISCELKGNDQSFLNIWKSLGDYRPVVSVNSWFERVFFSSFSTWKPSGSDTPRWVLDTHWLGPSQSWLSKQWMELSSTIFFLFIYLFKFPFLWTCHSSWKSRCLFSSVAVISEAKWTDVLTLSPFRRFERGEGWQTGWQPATVRVDLCLH